MPANLFKTSRVTGRIYLVLFFKVGEELQWRLHKELIPAKEANVAAQMPAVLVRCDHNIIVL